MCTPKTPPESFDWQKLMQARQIEEKGQSQTRIEVQPKEPPKPLQHEFPMSK